MHKVADDSPTADGFGYILLTELPTQLCAQAVQLQKPRVRDVAAQAVRSDIDRYLVPQFGNPLYDALAYKHNS